MAALDLSVEKNVEFEKLYEEQFQLVYNYMRCHSSNRVDAEDLTADVFVRAYRYWDSFSDEKGSRGKWIGGIARNTVKTYVRNKAKGLQITEATEFVSEADIDDIENNYLREEYLRQVFAQVSKLPQRQRKLLIMKFSQGLSNKEIAEITDMSLSNVGVTLHRCMKKLKALLKDD